MLKNKGNSVAFKFEQIKIVSFDDKATYKTDPSSAFVNAVLNLSASAPAAWADYFNQHWKQHFYMMKRNAQVSGSRLEVYCVPDELQNLIVDLNKVISETNQAYEQHLKQVQEDTDQQAAAEAAEYQRLAQIKSTLKFD